MKKNVRKIVAAILMLLAFPGYVTLAICLSEDDCGMGFLMPLVLIPLSNVLVVISAFLFTSRENRKRFYIVTFLLVSASVLFTISGAIKVLMLWTIPPIVAAVIALIISFSINKARKNEA